MYVKITKEKIHSGSLVLVCPKYCYHGKPKKLVKHNHSEILLAYDCEKALQNLLKKIRCENKIFLINGYEEQNSTCSSEHQTGLAIDLSLKNSSENPKFPKEGLCEIFRVFMSDYGFIERFKKEKDYHFRYVGYPHSKIMQNLDLNLEDYLEFLKSYSPNNPYLFQNYKIYYFEVKKNFKIKCSFHTVLSGNNYDGVIVTEKN